MALFIYHRLCRLVDCVWRGFFVVAHRVLAFAGYLLRAVGGGSRDEREDAPPTATARRLDGVDTEPRPRGCGPQQGSGKERPPGGHSGGEQEEEEEEEEEEEPLDDDRVTTTDEYYCGYDSTWETKEGDRDKRSSRPLTSFRSRLPEANSPNSGEPGCEPSSMMGLSSAEAPGGVGVRQGGRRTSSMDESWRGSQQQPLPNKFRRFESAAKDMQNYRRGYPKKPQCWKKVTSQDDMPNFNFYLGRARSQPDGALITDFHESWFGEYEALEHVHSYIQWLFPLQEPGVNNKAATLTKKEIECFLRSPTAKDYLFKSYMLMLDFYGIELSNKETGEVMRSSNWEERFRNLNTHTHNNLRITRILKCLGTLGFPQYQAPLVRFFLTETLVHNRLPNVKDSVLNYFVFAVLDKRSRRDLIKFAFLSYDRNDEFVWCPKKFQRRWAREAAEGKSTGC